MQVIRWFGALLRDSALLLPRAVRRLAGGDPVAGLALLPSGVLAWLAVLLATLDELRVLFLYPLTDDVTPGTWGGPTMAGAWAVHALLGVLLFPVFVGVMLGLRALARGLDSRPRRWWPVVVADVVTLAFLVAFVRQL